MTPLPTVGTGKRRVAEQARRGIALLLAVAMGIVAVASLLRPFNDPDFFWHLKTGEWIWQHRQLPALDPFGPPNAAEPNTQQRFTLTAYWLAQIFYHLAFSALGMQGILALKFLTALLLLGALLKLRRGDPLVHAALVLTSLPLLFNSPFDRPEVFSFVLFAAILGLLERERTSAGVLPRWQSYLPIPLLMLLWANVHGGHVLGQVTLLLFPALEGAKFLHPSLRPVGRERYLRILVLAAAGIAASLLNPNTYHGIGIVTLPSGAPNFNWEYVSAAAFYRGRPLLAVIWGTLALAALSAVTSIRRPDLTWLALMAGTGYEGLAHVRYLPFFVIAALPAIGSLLSARPCARWGRPFLVAGSLVFAGFMVKDELPTPERFTLAMRVNEQFYPVGAADYILANAPLGNLYNTYLWGGYLLWRLAPERTVFVDGRGLDPGALQQSFAINGAYAKPGDTIPGWKRLLQDRRIGIMVIPRVRTSRGIVFDGAAPLRAALRRTPEWVPVYADDISLVYLRSIPEHFDLFRRHAIPTEALAEKPRGK
jgi:hypothetical protein